MVVADTQCLTGKRIAVTGAGRGLGAAYARLAGRHGARVVVNDIDVDEAEAVAAQIVAEGGIAVADGSDIATWDGAQRVTRACLSAFGGIDGLINNAAIFWMAEPADDDPDALRRMIEVNLMGTAFCGMAAARAMMAQGTGGAILNVTSGAQSGSGRMTAYGATKGGIASLTYGWALDFAPHGIRVNAISPLAFTRTAQSIEPLLHKDKPPESVAPVAVYLLSDLSASINGQVVFVSGDEIALISHPAVALPTATRANRESVDAVACVFDEVLAQHQLPVGRSRQSIEVVWQSDEFTVR